MSTYTLSPAAYTLPLLHAAAHPSTSVSGLLLGTTTPTTITVTTALPLVHRYSSLTPTTELGIDLARAVATKSGLVIVGYYLARAGGEIDLGRVGEQVLAALRTEEPRAIGLVLDNNRLKAGAPAYNTFVPKSADTVALPDRKVVEGALKFVKDGLHEDVRDLDDHLDDASADWENAEVVARISR